MATRPAASEATPGASRLRVEDLHVEFATPAGPARAVDGVSFTLGRGETLALVGESGCGKTATALALLRLHREPPARVTGAGVWLGERDLLAMPRRALPEVRGKEIAMIFQEPMSALNPVFSCGEQVAEVLRVHEGRSRRDAWDGAVATLGRVGLPAPEQVARAYPHQLSGGMRQRVMIAMALAGQPRILVADEPTTALDVTLQARILELLRDVQTQDGLGILLITHDMGVVAETADRVAVMYAGRIVETAPASRLFAAPEHPYTRALLASIPRLDAPPGDLPVIPGRVPPPTQWPAGCRFAPRCSMRQAACVEVDPEERVVADGHHVRCILAQGPSTSPEVSA